MYASLPKPSNRSVILLLANYFIGYMVVYPWILSRFTLWLNPYATFVPLPLQAVAYTLTFLLTLWAAYPILVHGYHSFRKQSRNYIVTILFHSMLILVLNVSLSLIVSFFTNTTTSSNQTEIIQSSQLQPIFNFIITIGFAPFVEECVFRGGVFLKAREKYSFLVAALISGVTFGLIHVVTSLSSGNYADVMYIFVYGGIGLILSYTFEKTKSIYACMAVHALSNFIALLFIYL